MASLTRNDARINVRLPSELKHTIEDEDAASALGQTVSDFAISTVVREAQVTLRVTLGFSCCDRNQLTVLAGRGECGFHHLLRLQRNLTPGFIDLSGQHKLREIAEQVCFLSIRSTVAVLGNRNAARMVFHIEVASAW